MLELVYSTTSSTVHDTVITVGTSSVCRSVEDTS
jgi:hypothetical protein